MSASRLESIAGFRLVTTDLDRLTGFYRDVLGFAVDGAPRPIRSAEMASLGLTGGGLRQFLSIGAQSVALDHFESPGQPYPAGSDAGSLWFQHLALVVADMAEAYHRLSDAAPITKGGPQRLPPSSGGVAAFKFRDLDGHPLELLQFPINAAPPRWRGAAKPGQIALGIDHSAISVADADASLAFYQDLGLRPGKGSDNRGVEQERLDGLDGVEVRVAPLWASVDTPHLELLAYQSPTPSAGAALNPNDIAATRIVWRGDAAGLLRDPDGHLHQVEG